MYKYGHIDWDKFRDYDKDFCDDEEKIADFFLLSKSEFLTQYSYITEEEWSATYNRIRSRNERFYIR